MRDRDYCLPEFEEGLAPLRSSMAGSVVESVLKSESLGLAGTLPSFPTTVSFPRGRSKSA